MLEKTKKPRILSVETVAQSKIFTIEALELVFSNNEKRIYERFVSHDRDAVLMVPILGDKLILIEEYAAGTDRYELGFPKGSMDLNETMQESANRELKEEIGYGANELIYMRTLSSSPNVMKVNLHIFIAKDLYPEKLAGDEPEPLEVIEYPLADIDKLLVDPNFNESRNLTALYLLRDYLASAK